MARSAYVAAFVRRWAEVGVDCEFVYPSAPDAVHKDRTAFLIAMLRE